MEYITAQEAARKWGISVRLVQKYCAGGRIRGVVKFGQSWGIPENAVKPSDPRGKKEKNQGTAAGGELFSGLMPLMNSAFEPGHCLEVIEAMEDGSEKDIAMAEYYYFSGQPEQAVEAAEVYLTSPDTGARLSACLIYAYANLSAGNIQHARHALDEIRNTLAAGEEKNACVHAIEAFVTFVSSVLLHLPLPDSIPPTEAFLSDLPPGVRAFALYTMAHYLYLKEEYGKSAGIAEATLAMGADKYPIPAIYLHLVAVMDYMSMKNAGMARKHLLAAWETARPDYLIEGMGEHHGLLGGMLEAVVKPEWPEDFKRIIAITYRFSTGWRRIHNPETGHDVADDLTTTEFAAGMLAARGWTNQEIAEHMNISPNTVKQYISAVLQKLGIHQRRELKKYMLK